MVDLVQIQNDLVAILLSSDLLTSINIKSYRAMRLKQELDYNTLLTTERNGKQGAGIIVLMPTAKDKNPNVSGPVLGWEFGIVVLENDSINMDAPAGGTLLDAETIGQRVMDVLHLEADERWGTFNIGMRAMEPEKEYVFPGCIGYRVSLLLSSGRNNQRTRVAALQMTADSNPITSMKINPATIACSTTTADARIRYTLNGTHPADINGGNPDAKDYDGPFTVTDGDIVRVAAYADGMNKSATRYFEVAAT